MKLSPRAKRERAKKRKAAELAAIKKHRKHVVFYTLLVLTIIAVRVAFPDAVYEILDEGHTLLQTIKVIAKDGTTTVLTLVGLGYALKELWKAFKS